MTYTEIINELRRSATKDKFPFVQCHIKAWYEAMMLSQPHSLCKLKDDDLRMFYLLVACALEDQQ